MQKIKSVVSEYRVRGSVVVEALYKKLDGRGCEPDEVIKLHQFT
jgi:hypothetical protein